MGVLRAEGKAGEIVRTEGIEGQGPSGKTGDRPLCSVAEGGDII